jgi:hypothetical protein
MMLHTQFTLPFEGASMRKLKAIAVVALFLVLGSSAQATIWTFNVTIDGAQERPNPVVTTATGLATAIFDDATGSMNITGTYTGLTSASILAHLHGYAPLGNPGDPGTSAPPVIDLTHSSATSGTISGSGTIPSARIADVLGGLSYINIPRVNFPGGAIRGQVVNPVPEPATIVMAGIGLFGFGYLALRRRRASA